MYSEFKMAEAYIGSYSSSSSLEHEVNVVRTNSKQTNRFAIFIIIDVLISNYEMQK
jgi:hypothetical protein